MAVFESRSFETPMIRNSSGSAPLISRGKPKALKKSRAARLPGKNVLRLFVAGATARSRQAILRVRQLSEAELKDNCTLEVIDIYQQPIFAKEGQIVAAPTLVTELPPPLRKFIGDLSNTERILVGLDLRPKK